MSRDNWERLAVAVLRRQDDLELCFASSPSLSFSPTSSEFISCSSSFSLLDENLNLTDTKVQQTARARKRKKKQGIFKKRSIPAFNDTDLLLKLRDFYYLGHSRNVGFFGHKEIGIAACETTNISCTVFFTELVKYAIPQEIRVMSGGETLLVLHCEHFLNNKGKELVFEMEGDGKLVAKFIRREEVTFAQRIRRMFGLGAGGANEQVPAADDGIWRLNDIPGDEPRDDAMQVPEVHPPNDDRIITLDDIDRAVNLNDLIELCLKCLRKDRGYQSCPELSLALLPTGKNSVWLLREDVTAVIDHAWLDHPHMSVWMSFIHARMVDKDKYKFLDPEIISKDAVKVGPRGREGAFKDAFEGAKEGQVFVAPYNTGQHWILMLIEPDKRLVVWLDSLHGDVTPEARKLMNRVFNSRANIRALKTVPRQPESWECGYYICMYMKSIILEGANYSEHWVDSYMMEEIDEFRSEFLRYVLTLYAS